MMVDVSEAFLEIDRTLRKAYELLLKGRKQEAANLFEEIARLSENASIWIKNET